MSSVPIVGAAGSSSGARQAQSTANDSSMADDEEGELSEHEEEQQDEAATAVKSEQSSESGNKTADSSVDGRCYAADARYTAIRDYEIAENKRRYTAAPDLWHEANRYMFVQPHFEQFMHEWNEYIV